VKRGTRVPARSEGAYQTPRSNAEIERVLARAERQLSSKKKYPNVLGVALGRRRADRDWLAERVITVFVSRKVAPSELRRGIIPPYITAQLNGKRLRLPTDVISVGEARGRAQAVAPGDSVKVAPGSGHLSWVAAGQAVTAEHVTGFGAVGAAVTGPSGPIGSVTRVGYEVDKVDAALIQLLPGTAVTNVVGGRTVGRARYTKDADIYSPTTGRLASVYLAGNGGFTPVAIRHIHVGPFFTLVGGDGTEFTPRPLTLTDLCTDFGDSGTVLLGDDNRPLALLSGIVDADDGHSYSCFTELGAALDTLNVNW